MNATPSRTVTDGDSNHSVERSIRRSRPAIAVSAAFGSTTTLFSTGALSAASPPSGSGTVCPLAPPAPAAARHNAKPIRLKPFFMPTPSLARYFGPFVCFRVTAIDAKRSFEGERSVRERDLDPCLIESDLDRIDHFIARTPDIERPRTGPPGDFEINA